MSEPKALSEICPVFGAATKDLLNSMSEEIQDCTNWDSELDRNEHMERIGAHMDKVSAAMKHNNDLARQHTVDGYCDACRPNSSLPSAETLDDGQGDE